MLCLVIDVSKRDWKNPFQSLGSLPLFNKTSIN